MALVYEAKYSKAYLPRIGLLPLEPYVTSSGMAALTTAIVAIHRAIGVNVTVLVGKHSYFQNLEVIESSFNKVIIFDETNRKKYLDLMRGEKPRVIFVDSLCNEVELTRPKVDEIIKDFAGLVAKPSYVVIDNSMLSIKFDWRAVLRQRSSKFGIIGFESLNKYHQFGIDRTTGGIVFGTGKMNLHLVQARRHAGTIMPDINVAMLPSPNYKMLKLYIERIWENRERLAVILGDKVVASGGQVVVKFDRKMSYAKIQKVIKTICWKAKKQRVQIVAGTSFGMPNTRVYLTAKDSKYTKMFLRVSCGCEDEKEFEKVIGVISSVVSTENYW